MKPTGAQIKQCVSDWGALKFFPADEAARLVIMRLLASMVGRAEQLAWLQDMMVNRVGEWPGPAQLRALFCTRFPAADGIEGPSCELRGHTAAEIEGERPRYESLPAGEARKLLAGVVATSEPPLSDEERAEMDALNERIRAKAEQFRQSAKTPAMKTVADVVEDFRAVASEAKRAATHPQRRATQEPVIDTIPEPPAAQRIV